MGWWQRIFGGESGKAVPDVTEPFMEHPTSEFNSAVAAMEDAINRLRKLPNWDQWITFSAQGQGETADDYQFAELQMLCDELDVGDSVLDVSRIVEAAGVRALALEATGPHYSMAGASPAEAARILDAVFRQHFGIRPTANEGDDYAVGAEW